MVLLSVYLYAQRVPYDPNTMNYNISPTQAIQAAKDWIGNQNLQLEVSGVDIAPAEYDITPEYALKTSDGSQIFNVCTNTGIVRMWTNKTIREAHLRKCRPGKDISTMLPKSEINAARIAFLTAHYPGFVQFNMETTFDDHIYAERLPNGAVNMFRRVVCIADDWTGEVYYYFAPAASSSPISTQFTVQKHQAEQTALSHVRNLDWYAEPAPNEGGEGSNVKPASCFIYGDSEVQASPFDSNTNALAWVVRVVSNVYNPTYTIDNYRSYILSYEQSELDEYDGNIVCWNVFVDANTGAVKGCFQTDQYSSDPLSVAAPTFSPDGGSYIGTQTVTMSCSEPGSTIRYTTDGSKPTSTSTLYTTAISVNSNITIKARAFKANLRSSEVKSAAYVIQ